MGVREEKVQFVEALSERLKSNSCVLMADYRGLTVAEMNELRKQLREADRQPSPSVRKMW
jgi:large subunit ribosomal protein L10